MYYPWGVLLENLVVASSSLNPDPISDQKCHFDTRFQTRTLKSIPVFRPCFQAEIMSWFIRSEHKQKIYSNAFRIRIFLFFLFHLKLIRKIRLYAPSVRSKTILGSREKFTPVLRGKRSKNHTLWGRTQLYGLYKRFFHPPPPPGYFLTYFFLHRSSVC